MHHDVAAADQNDTEVWLDLDMADDVSLKIQHDLMGQAGRDCKWDASPGAGDISMHVAKEHVADARAERGDDIPKFILALQRDLIEPLQPYFDWRMMHEH